MGRVGGRLDGGGLGEDFLLLGDWKRVGWMEEGWRKVGSRSKLFSCSAHLSFTLPLTFIKYNPIQSRG